jgi:hypothetical protein
MCPKDSSTDDWGSKATRLKAMRMGRFTITGDSNQARPVSCHYDSECIPSKRRRYIIHNHITNQLSVELYSAAETTQGKGNNESLQPASPEL